jgi:two-component system nitrate/nitrite sensor histidine kinase NarX
VLHGLQNLTLLHDIELRVYDMEDEKNHQEFTCHSDITCDDRGAIYVRAASCLLPLAAVPP